MRYLLHLAAIYGLTQWFVLFFAGWTRGVLLPLLGHPPKTSEFQFLFSHLLAFSCIPAFIAGFGNARLRHAVAQFVWVAPGAILAYKIATYPHAVSVLYATTGAGDGFYHYFDWSFTISEFSTYAEMFQLYAGNADVFRGFDQLHFTAPLYAGLAYSVATLICMRWKRSLPDVVESLETWHRGTRLERNASEAAAQGK